MGRMEGGKGGKRGEGDMAGDFIARGSFVRGLGGIVGSPRESAT